MALVVLGIVLSVWMAYAQSNPTVIAPRAKVTANTTFTIRANHTVFMMDDLIAYQCFVDGMQVGMDIDPSENVDGTIDCVITGGVAIGNHDVTIGALYDMSGLFLAVVLPIVAV